MAPNSRNPRRLVVPIALLAGLMLGYALGWLQHRSQERPSPAEVRLPAVVAPAAVNADASAPAILPVQLADENDVVVASPRGLLLAPGDRLVLPLAALHHARHGVFRFGGRILPLGDVMGINATAGLAIVATDLPALDSGLVLDDSVTLYLGLELEILSMGEETFDGWVDTAAQQNPGGQIVYGVRSRTVQPIGLTPLTLPGTRVLAGLLTGGGLGNDLYEAVDTAALTAVGSPLPGLKTSVSIARFSQDFFTRTPAGRKFSFKSAAAHGDWQQIIQLGPALLSMSAGDAEVAEILEHAYLERVKTALNNRDAAFALQILDTADAVLPASAALANARASSLHLGNRHMEALEVLHRAIDNGIADNTTYALAQNLVLMLVEGERLSHDEKQRLLEQAILREPAVAFYHARLGESFYRQGRYAEALTQLNYAAQLDSGLHDELQALMNNARARLQTPGRVVVPLMGDGNAYYIDVAINGAPRRLLLDTGATFTTLSTSLANELGLAVPRDTPQVRLSTANGVISAPMITVDTISLNGATVANLDVVVLDNIGGNGLLGLNFLNNFNIDIDQANAEMTLRRR
ncbi:MAG TPA: TIGR02281 family clan AA aspartic protease [Gammaproteobacteria bacterium]